MKVICSVVVLVACGALVSGCGDATGSAATPVVAHADLLGLLPDAAAYPDHLTAPASSMLPHAFTMDSLAGETTWNGFGSLIPKASYQPAGCSATHNPDTAPNEGRTFALALHDYEEKSKALLPTQSAVVGATVARGTVDQAAVQALAVECATVFTGEDVAARYEVLPNPKVDPAQVLAVRTAFGKNGDYFKLTYVAQVSDYTVTAYALCSTPTVCDAEMTPVFRSGITKARTAG